MLFFPDRQQYKQNYCIATAAILLKHQYPLFYSFKYRIKICDQIFYFFNSDWKPDRVWFDSWSNNSSVHWLWVVVADESPEISAVYRKKIASRKDRQLIDKCRTVCDLPNLKVQDRAASVREILYNYGLTRFQWWCVQLYLRMIVIPRPAHCSRLRSLNTQIMPSSPVKIKEWNECCTCTVIIKWYRLNAALPAASERYTMITRAGFEVHDI